MASPPENDVCSVCHDRFTLPCQANCSHWFCGFSSSEHTHRCPRHHQLLSKRGLPSAIDNLGILSETRHFFVSDGKCQTQPSTFSSRTLISTGEPSTRLNNVQRTTHDPLLSRSSFPGDRLTIPIALLFIVFVVAILPVVSSAVRRGGGAFGDRASSHIVTGLLGASTVVDDNAEVVGSDAQLDRIGHNNSKEVVRARMQLSAYESCPVEPVGFASCAGEKTDPAGFASGGDKQRHVGEE
ncbi:hypothetical protein KSP40_PGU006101 [Platanthera guangdongensis]|uniref:Uncharacterized protein n=1 Tax=Platanthera guangdongensis TaxID=2320717 RepID=A0ABR2N3I4_9ASPA